MSTPEKQKEAEGVYLKNSWKLPKLNKENGYTRVHDANRIPCLNTKKDLFQDIILKLSKVNEKERILKAVRGIDEDSNLQTTLIRLSVDFSAETPLDKREKSDISKY